MLGTLTLNVWCRGYGFSYLYSKGEVGRADAGADLHRHAPGKMFNAMHNSAGQVFDVYPVANLTAAPHDQRVFAATRTTHDGPKRILKGLVSAVPAEGAQDHHGNALLMQALGKSFQRQLDHAIGVFGK